MGYTYKGKDYPLETKLNYPEFGDILRKPKGEFTLDEVSWLLNLDCDMVREDCNALILNEIGRQWGKSSDVLEEDGAVNPCIINNSLILLTGSTDDDSGETSDILVELLCQSDDFLRFNRIDIGDDMQHSPIVTAVYNYYSLSPQQLIGMLLKDDVADTGKRLVAQMIGIIGSNLRQKGEYGGIEAEVYEQLCAALKDAFNKYAVNSPKTGKLDRQSLSCLVEAMATVGVHDAGVQFDAAVERLFHEGYIDEDIISEEDAIDGMECGGWDCMEPVTDVRELLFSSLVFYKGCF